MDTHRVTISGDFLTRAGTAAVPALEGIDLVTANMRPVYKIAEERLGTRPSPSAIWRWVRKGTRGVKLPAVSHGNVWFTTDEAFAAFLLDQTQVALETNRQQVSDAMLRGRGLLD